MTGPAADTVGPARSATGRARMAAGDRWELLRALGALILDDPTVTPALSRALGLPEWSRADHTGIFVLDLPPYASIHLGPEGKLGGEGGDRVAGFWRTLDLDPPSDADHLCSLLALYAELGTAAQECVTAAAAARLDHARAVLLWEHLWSWVPGYLAAVAQDPAGKAWAELTGQALRAEAEATPEPPELPAALRHAPEPLDPGCDLAELLDGFTAPVRAGFVLTYRDLLRAGAEIGVGVRRGERRFALRSMMEQDPVATLRWSAGHARRWARIHGDQPDHGAGTGRWWAQRAAATASCLDEMRAGR